MHLFRIALDTTELQAEFIGYILEVFDDLGYLSRTKPGNLRFPLILPEGISPPGKIQVFREAIVIQISLDETGSAFEDQIVLEIFVLGDLA